MIYINKFIDRVSLLDRTPGKDLVLPAQDAKMLRDEIAKLMSLKLDSIMVNQRQSVDNTILSGGKF
jgi:hypothetical protein